MAIQGCRHLYDVAHTQHRQERAFYLGYRDVEDLLVERGIDVSYVTISRWAKKFG